MGYTRERIAENEEAIRIIREKKVMKLIRKQFVIICSRQGPVRAGKNGFKLEMSRQG